MRARPAPETVDRTGGAERTGTLVLAACNVRRANALERTGPFTPPKSAPVLPLVAVDGRPVRLGAGMRVAVALAAGPHLVEVMDDHHYESRTVTVDEGGTARLWFGVGLLRSEPRLHLGSKEYAARSAHVDRRAEQIGAVVSLLVCVAGMALLYPRLDAHPAVPEHVPFLTVIALAVAAFWPVRALARALLRRRGPARIGAPDPQPVAPSADPAHEVMTVPRGAAMPPAAAAVRLSFRAEPKALKTIRIRTSVGGTGRKRTVPYFSNSPVDRLAAPEITVNGHSLPPRWATWWIPVRPGQVLLRVRLPGFIDDGRHPAPSATAELRLHVEAGQARHVECRYNIVELATARLRERPDRESEWQRVLREHRRLDRAVRRSRAPRLTLTALGAERIGAGDRASD
ncbi:MAG TPA: hypothetical protein VFU12_07510 [Glycomyces sp.]|nr:hypothetical protein [Glycomyces sp.]